METREIGLRRGIEFRWSPGHKRIPGNEEAHSEAELGAVASPEGAATPTLCHVKRVSKEMARQTLRSWWHDNDPESYRSLGIDFDSSPRELRLHRRTLQRLIAEQTGHGDFEPYHRRFQHHKGPPSLCRCGEERTRGHFAWCPALRIHPVPLESPIGPDRHTHFQRFLEKHRPYDGGKSKMASR